MTSMYEEKTIGRAIETLIGGYKGEFEILVSIPDEPTWEALYKKGVELGIQDKIIRSPLSLDGKPKGKPRELNALMDMARGDIWILGDGDTYFGNEVITKMIKYFDDPSVMAVTGRPFSSDNKNESKFAYYGHLLTDAAHHKRTIDLTSTPTGRSKRFVPKRKVFPISGYLCALRSSDIRAPEDTLVEDAYFTYEIFNRGGKVIYEPDAHVFVQFPKNMRDFYRQKKRSVGGYIQLWKYGVVSEETKSRSFWRELEYFWFPIKYAQGIRQLWWSFQLYPIRLWLWIRIYWERKIRRKDFFRTWVRVESTK